MNFENIIIEQKENLAIITINRPSKLNALKKIQLKNYMMLLSCWMKIQ